MALVFTTFFIMLGYALAQENLGRITGRGVGWLMIGHQSASADIDRISAGSFLRSRVLSYGAVAALTPSPRMASLRPTIWNPIHRLLEYCK
jgi:hypothetical protein